LTLLLPHCRRRRSPQLCTHALSCTLAAYADHTTLPYRRHPARSPSGVFRLLRRQARLTQTRPCCRRNHSLHVLAQPRRPSSSCRSNDALRGRPGPFPGKCPAERARRERANAADAALPSSSHLHTRAAPAHTFRTTPYTPKTGDILFIRNPGCQALAARNRRRRRARPPFPTRLSGLKSTPPGLPNDRHHAPAQPFLGTDPAVCARRPNPPPPPFLPTISRAAGRAQKRSPAPSERSQPRPRPGIFGADPADHARCPNPPSPAISRAPF
jgi:hypothetical protein